MTVEIEKVVVYLQCKPGDVIEWSDYEIKDWGNSHLIIKHEGNIKITEEGRLLCSVESGEKVTLCVDTYIYGGGLNPDEISPEGDICIGLDYRLSAYSMDCPEVVQSIKDNGYNLYDFVKENIQAFNPYSIRNTNLLSDEEKQTLLNLIK